MGSKVSDGYLPIGYFVYTFKSGLVPVKKYLTNDRIMKIAFTNLDIIYKKLQVS